MYKILHTQDEWRIMHEKIIAALLTLIMATALLQDAVRITGMLTFP